MKRSLNISNGVVPADRLFNTAIDTTKPVADEWARFEPRLADLWAAGLSWHAIAEQLARIAADCGDPIEAKIRITIGSAYLAFARDMDSTNEMYKTAADAAQKAVEQFRRAAAVAKESGERTEAARLLAAAEAECDDMQSFVSHGLGDSNVACGWPSHVDGPIEL